MKTLEEIKDYCKNSCSHKDCSGKWLRFNRKPRMFCGIITTPANSWYCTYHEYIQMYKDSILDIYHKDIAMRCKMLEGEMLKVESYAGWIIVDTNNKRIAHKEGIQDFGRGNIKSITKATKEDIDYLYP